MSKNNKEVFSRINYLYQAAHLMSCECPFSDEIVRYYLKVMCNISKKSLHKLHYEVKRTICKKCKSLLVPGTTATIRYRGKNKHVVLRCSTCGQIRRFRSVDYKLWCKQQELEEKAQ